MKRAAARRRRSVRRSPRYRKRNRPGPNRNAGIQSAVGFAGVSALIERIVKSMDETDGDETGVSGSIRTTLDQVLANYVQ